jgi:hypothetical protein
MALDKILIGKKGRSEIISQTKGWSTEMDH